MWEIPALPAAFNSDPDFARAYCGIEIPVGTWENVVTPEQLHPDFNFKTFNGKTEIIYKGFGGKHPRTLMTEKILEALGGFAGDMDKEGEARKTIIVDETCVTSVSGSGGGAAGPDRIRVFAFFVRDAVHAARRVFCALVRCNDASNFLDGAIYETTCFVPGDEEEKEGKERKGDAKVNKGAVGVYKYFFRNLYIDGTALHNNQLFLDNFPNVTNDHFRRLLGASSIERYTRYPFSLPGDQIDSVCEDIPLSIIYQINGEPDALMRAEPLFRSADQVLFNDFRTKTIEATQERFIAEQRKKKERKAKRQLFKMDLLKPPPIKIWRAMTKDQQAKYLPPPELADSESSRINLSDSISAQEPE